MARILTPERAARAIYFDFEGCADEAPSLLGWSLAIDMNELSRLVALPPTVASADAQRRFALRMCFAGWAQHSRPGHALG